MRLKALIAAALIAASTAPALAGHIKNELDACIAQVLAIQDACLRRSSNEGERALCGIEALTFGNACGDSAKDAVAINPRDW